MNLRRAILLFAIVLGLGALAASLAPPPRDAERSRRPSFGAPQVTRPSRDSVVIEIDFAVGARRRTAQIDAGRHVVVTVKATRPGQAEIGRLGVVAATTPAVPARFDLLPDHPGRYRVSFVPADGGPPELVGVLAVSPG